MALTVPYRRELASHPIGTTVRLINLFKHIPVRKQTALKVTAKCLAKLKKTLHAYAFARPAVRFSLRILKAKNEGGNWMYAPKSGASVEDVALKVVGKECATQCSRLVVDFEGYTVHSLLPKLSADPAKISNVGHFLSVDHRPLSTGRSSSTMNQIFKAFKERLKAADTRFADVKDPFICLSIACPAGTYDANVEPAKDDVIFEDSEKVLTAVRQAFDQIYPTPAPPAELIETESRRTSPTLDLEDVENNPERPSKRQCVWRPSTHGTNNDDAIAFCRPQAQQTQISDGDAEEEESHCQDVKTSNPWIIAKMTAPVRPRRSSPARRTPLRQRSDSDQNSSPEKRLTVQSSMPAYPPWNLSTPQPTSSPERPETARGLVSRDNCDSLRDTPASFSSVTPQSPPCSLQSFDAEPLAYQTSRQNATRQQWTTANDFVAAGQLPLGTQASLHDANQADATTNPNQSGRRLHDIIGRPQLASRANRLFQDPGQRPFKSPLKRAAPRNAQANTSSPSRDIEVPHKSTRRDRDIREILGTNSSNLLPQTFQPNLSNRLRHNQRDALPYPAHLDPGAAAERETDDSPSSSALEAIEDESSQHPRIRRVEGPPPPSSPPSSSLPLKPHADPAEPAPALELSKALPVHAERQQRERDRRRTRTRSSTAHLPLERTPPHLCLSGTVASLTITIDHLARLARTLSQLRIPQAEHGPLSGQEGHGTDQMQSSLCAPAVREEEVEGWREQLVRFLEERGEEVGKVGPDEEGGETKDEGEVVGLGEWTRSSRGEGGDRIRRVAL